MLLESYLYPYNSFVTLTINDEYLPVHGRSVSKDVMSAFLKRLRQHLKYEFGKSAPVIKFFGAAEYGKKNLRPHYHFIIFNFNPRWLRIVEKSWKYQTDKGLQSCGFVSAYSANRQTMRYTCKYIQKSNSEFKEMLDREGLAPEFHRMSTRPALGSAALEFVAPALTDTLIQSHGGDVPKLLSFSGRKMPLGRTLVKKLRELKNLDVEKISQEKQAEMRALYFDTAFVEALQNPYVLTSGSDPSIAALRQLNKENVQKIKNIKSREANSLRAKI